jgi:hypothetical protein
MPLKKTLNAMPTNSEIFYFDNDHYFGFEIQWSKKGRGFGRYTFSVDKSNGKFSVDNEDDSKETMKNIIDDLVDNHKESIREMFYEMLEKVGK